MYKGADPSPALRAELGAILRDNGYELRPLLETLFLSRDFYSEASYGGHIKGPVVHVVTMLKQLGAEDVPGVPDFNDTTIALGQHLLNPPSVAGWAQGRAWITPALLQARRSWRSWTPSSAPRTRAAPGPIWRIRCAW